MQIWIDGDACPKPIKEIVFRAAIRTQRLLMIVSNHNLTIPASPFIRKHQVGAGFDMADRYIAENIKPGDLVITADIPLADIIITNGGFALNPRGEMYTANNVKSHLSMRNFNEVLRGAQMLSGGPPKISAREIQSFANGLDRFLAGNVK
ncbi:YaiI/YqxD family protein [Legionella quinlivanii]|uniref:YaiI/YqxD family protein n=1 Tax=Legionella quinlivanii TaxID=45073 RepID=UPI0022438B57|nr:YaiI/YqxD family protein [Legionella quinlivanii]MCW8450521.1 YaiI/YqxD family protein [Legionella quinlivanii]